MLGVSSQILEEQCISLKTKVLPIFEALSKTDLKEENQMQKEMELGCSKYESLLQVWLNL